MSPENTRYKILAVDDEQRMVRFIQLNLEQDGFEVITAFNGKEALEQVRTQLPDLILLDIMMPDINGFEVLKKIREVNTVPVIMLTAKARKMIVSRGLSWVLMTI
jgi:DNA-binding response OmpR family regulator